MHTLYPNMQTNTSQIQMQKIRTNRNKGPDRFCGKLPTSNLKVPIEQKICQPVSPITLDMCEETVVELSTVDSSIDSPSLSGMYSKNGTIGLRGLPLQVERRTRRLGGLFNLMVVGSPGCGKSTLINTLFGEVLLPESKPSISTEYDATSSNYLRMVLTLISPSLMFLNMALRLITRMHGSLSKTLSRLSTSSTCSNPSSQTGCKEPIVEYTVVSTLSSPQATLKCARWMLLP